MTDKLSTIENQESSVDFSKVEPEDQGNGSWYFGVKDLKTRRALALEMARELGADEYDLESLQDSLNDTKPISDLRLDGKQISFIESDETRRMRAGEIVGARIAMKNGQTQADYLATYNSAIAKVLEKIEKAKSNNSFTD